MTNQVYKTREWKRVRAQVLARDNFECQIRLPKCTGRATAVDHIVPLADGGAPYEMSGLRSACSYCNTAIGNTARATRGRYGEPWDELAARYGIENVTNCGVLSPEDRLRATGYDF